MFKLFLQASGTSFASVGAVLILFSRAVVTELPGVRPTQQSANLVTEQSSQSLKEDDLHFSAYSLNAAALQLDSIFSVLDQSQFHFYSTASETQISEPMGDRRAIVQNLETELSEAKPDKSRYNLFNPTPRNLLREFATDRPDTTESPFTVDAGHFQFEAELVSFSSRSSDEEGNTTEDLLFTATNLKVGLLNNVDLQLVVQPYTRSRIKLRDSNQVEETAGFDALVARVKVNIYGNDAFEKPGATALAVMPFISIPTVQDGVGGNFVEGGLIIPFSVNLSDQFALALMTQFDMIKNAQSNGYHIEYVNTASLGYTVTDRLGTFLEIATRFGNESRFGGVVTLNAGLTFDLGNDLQLDGGVNVGLTRASDDVRTFLGLSKRF
ncbi:hypothetical protein FACHB389_02860 [Nostoc calcicola FACHB-389]|nr:hypothetical protein FACHB389_02860 [Nostoc calcicola FACHB-389]